jgi:dTMP kinase
MATSSRQSARIIVLTGIDGAGKTSAGELLTLRLSEKGYPATFTTNPSGRRSIGAWCERHRIHPPAVLLDAVETVIRCFNVAISHLRAGNHSRVVIMDRHLYCQLALRRVRGLRRGWFLPLLLRVLPAPEAVIYFDVGAEVAYNRIKSRASDTESLEHLTMFDRAYRELPDFQAFTIIDASRSTTDAVDDMMRALGL